MRSGGIVIDPDPSSPEDGEFIDEYFKRVGGEIRIKSVSKVTPMSPQKVIPKRVRFGTKSEDDKIKVPASRISGPKTRQTWTNSVARSRSRPVQKPPRRIGKRNARHQNVAMHEIARL